MTVTMSRLQKEYVCVYVCLKAPHILVESVVQLCHVVIASVTIGSCRILLELGRCTGSTRTSPTGVEVLSGGGRTSRVSCVSSELVGHTVWECD